MAFRHKVLHIRRQKQRLIDIPGAKILAHSPSLNQTRSELNSDYSDRLLGLLDFRYCQRGLVVRANLKDDCPCAHRVDAWKRCAEDPAPRSRMSNQLSRKRN